MTFGKTLKEIMTATGVKGSQLAAAIGYDASYISRWINQEKLPSSKNINELFKRIAEYAIYNSSEQERFSLIRGLELDDTGEAVPELLIFEIETALRHSYDKQRIIMSGIESTTKFIGNSSIMCDYNTDIIFSTIAEAVYSAYENKENSEVEIITTFPISDEIQAVNLMAFLNELRDSNHFIHVRHLIDIHQAKTNSDQYCRRLLESMVQRPNLKYEYHIIDRAELCGAFFLVVKDELYIRQIAEPFSRHPIIITTKDPHVVSECFYSAEGFIHNKAQLFAKAQYIDRNVDNFLLNYMWQKEFWHILTIMHPLYLSEEFSREIFLCNNEANDQWNYLFAKQMHCAKKTVVIYKSAIIDYLFNGRIVVAGAISYFDVPMRIRHLTELVDFLASGAQCRMVIVEDENPYLGFKEIEQSVYFGAKAGYATFHGKEKYSVICKDVRLVESFIQFTEHLADIPAPYALSGDSVINYLKRSIGWLQSNFGESIH